jgi:hypothetical protein
MDSKKALIRIFTFLGGIYFFFHFIAPESALQAMGIHEAHPAISNGFITVGAMAIGLGVVNLLMGHGAHVAFKRRGWIFSLLLLLSLGITLVVTSAQWIINRSISRDLQQVYVIGEFSRRIAEDVAEDGAVKSFSPSGMLPSLDIRVSALEEYARRTIAGVQGKLSKTIATPSSEDLALVTEMRKHEKLLLTDLDRIATLSWNSYAESNKDLLAAISKSAGGYATAYSIIRRRSAERGLVARTYTILYTGLFENLGAAMFALLGVYIAAAAFRAFRIKSLESTLMMMAALVVMLGQISLGKFLYDDLPALRQWLLEIPNSAVFRAIRFGAAVAGLMLAIRMWFSIESTSSSEGK